MSATLVLILVVVGAYLAAHIAFEWFAKRLFIVSGAEYLLLGILLGPQVSGLIGASVVSDFAPIMTLALGVMGVLVGTQFFLPNLLRFEAALYKIAFTQSGLLLATVAGIMTLAFTWLFGLTPGQAVIPAAATSMVAVATAPSGVRIVARQLRWRGAVMDQLTITDTINGFVAIAAFGLLLCMARESAGGTPSSVTPIEWMVVSVGIGFVGGSLFHLFLGAEEHLDRLAVALIGAIILTTGAAAYLELSPLLPTFLIGVILVNTSPVRQQVRELLTRIERPFYYVLLIFAGAAWQPGPEAWLLPVVLFLVTQTAAAIGSARLATRLNGKMSTIGPQWGVALLGHGELALAIGLNYQLHGGAPLADLVFTATIASVLLTHLTSARVVRSVARAGIGPPVRPPASVEG